MIAIGCALIIFRKWFVEGSIDFQKRVYGVVIGGKMAIKIGYWFVPITGLFSIILGILGLLGVVK